MTTLLNIARALGLELMLIPQALMPAVQSLLQDVERLYSSFAHHQQLPDL